MKFIALVFATIFILTTFSCGQSPTPIPTPTITTPAPKPTTPAVTVPAPTTPAAVSPTPTSTPSPKPLGEKFPITLKLKKGDAQEIKYSVTQQTFQTVTGRPTAITQSTNITFYMTVKDIDPAGTLTCQFTYKTVAFRMTGGSTDLQYDSESPAGSAADANPLALVYDLFIGESFQTKVSANGTIEEIKGIDELFVVSTEMVGMQPGESKDALIQQLTEMFGVKAMKDTLQYMWNVIPRTPVAIGESWTRQTEGPYNTSIQNNISLSGRNNGVAAIGINSNFQTRPEGTDLQQGRIIANYQFTGQISGSVNVNESNGFSGDGSLAQSLTGRISAYNLDTGARSSVPLHTETKIIFSSTDAPPNVLIPRKPLRMAVYSSPTQYYTISYPSAWGVNEENPAEVQFGIPSNMTANNVLFYQLRVRVDKVAVDSTATDYLATAKSNLMKRAGTANWNFVSANETLSAGAVTGYRFEYTFTENTEKMAGIGVLVKKGGQGYYAVFEALESKWDRLKPAAGVSINSFIAPNVLTGVYAGPAFSVTLPKGWSAIPTPAENKPLIFSSALGQPIISGEINVNADPKTTNSKDFATTSFISKILPETGLKLIKEGDFTFNDGSVGYELIITAGSGADLVRVRFIILVKGGKAYTVLFTGTEAAQDAQSEAVTQMMKTFAAK